MRGAPSRRVWVCRTPGLAWSNSTAPTVSLNWQTPREAGRELRLPSLAARPRAGARRGKERAIVKLRTLIVDDEPLARRRLRRLLRAAPCVEMVAECGDGLSAVAAVERERPDLLLLDIQMPELDGFAVLEALPAGRRPVTVFVTAYDSYAIRAFEACALDYILKPIEHDRLIKAVGRADEQGRLLGPGYAGRQPQV